MASNRSNDRQGMTGRNVTPFPNSQNPVQHSPFPNTPNPPTHMGTHSPYPPGNYGNNPHTSVQGQYYPSGSNHPPPLNTTQSGVVNRAAQVRTPYANPPSVPFTSSLDYNSQLPPAFSDPVPPPRFDELHPSQTVQAGVSVQKQSVKTSSGQVFHENLAAPTSVSFKSEEEALDSVVLLNTTKDFVTISVGTLPATDQLFQKSNLTLSYTITPLKPTEDVPLINYGTDPITRCKQCRAYINPFVRMDPSKRFWICNLCETSNELQPRHIATFQQYPGGLTATSLNNNPLENELKYGVVEYMASADYTVRQPQPPAYLFLIDVSSSAVNSRMLEVVCKTVSDLIIENLFTRDDRTQVGVMTFDSTVHYYQISKGQENFQLLVVSDLEDLFIPMPGEVLLNLQDSAEDILRLLETLPKLWKDTTTTGSALGSAVRSAHYSMKHVGGKLLVFTASPCLYGDFSLTEAQKNSSVPSSNNVLNMNKKPTNKLQPLEKCKDFSCMMAQTQTTLDLFVCTPQSLNLEKLHYLSSMTSGNVFYYPYKNHSENEKLVKELKYVVTRETVWESVMRIRLSKGWKVINWFGNCYVRGSDLMVLPTTSEDYSYTITFVPDPSTSSSNNTGTTKKVMYIQTALLHTTGYGERRIKVFNTAVGVSNDLGTVLNSVNVEPLVYSLLLGSLKVYQTSGKLVDSRSYLTTHCSRLTSSLSILGSTADSVRVLVMYVLGLLKSSLYTEEHNHDMRTYLSLKFKSCKLDQVMMYAYPQLYNLSNELSTDDFPFQGLPLTIESLLQECCYLLFNGEYILIWVGMNIPNKFLQDIFDAPSFDLLNVALAPTALQEMTTYSAHRLKLFMETLRNKVAPFPPLMVMKQGESDALFYSSLIQDKTQGMMISFQDFYNSMQPRSTLQPNR